MLLQTKIKKKCTQKQYLSFKEVENKLTFGPAPTDYINNRRTFTCWRIKLFDDPADIKNKI